MKKILHVLVKNLQPGMEAVAAALNSLVSNNELLYDSSRWAGRGGFARGRTLAPHWLEKLGVSLEQVHGLNIVHVSGTKGKGSTCAFVERILASHGYKTGLFTSPHMLDVRERIRINGRPVEKDVFISEFWPMFQCLKEETLQDTSKELGEMPAYFTFILMLALKIFIQEQVDVAVLEVGLGGEYDCTNFIQKPTVCGVTSLGYDHTHILGETIEEIAWNKAGIFKPGVPAITTEEPSSALQVLVDRAQEIQAPLYISKALTQDDLTTFGLHLGIDSQVQMINAGLAVQLCRLWRMRHMKKTNVQTNASKHEDTQLHDSKEPLPLISKIPKDVDDCEILTCPELSAETIKGLSTTFWPGRNQIIHKPKVTYYLDGAHTLKSIENCAEWFRERANEESKSLSSHVARVLLFNVSGPRDSKSFLAALKSCNFHVALFCSNQTYKEGNQPTKSRYHVDEMTVVEKNHKAWLDLHSSKGFQAADSSHPSNAVVGDECESSNLQSKNQFSETVGCSNDFIDMSGDVSNFRQTNISSKAQTFVSIEEAIMWITQGREAEISNLNEDVGTQSHPTPPEFANADHVQILITGSLYLVGGALAVIWPSMNDEAFEKCSQ